MTDRERPIDELHEQLLKRILKLDESQAIPDNVKDLYWDVNRTCRSIGFPMTERELVLVLVITNRLVQDAPVSFLDDVINDQVKTEDLVLAKFRNKWRWGNYKRLAGEKIVVQLQDETAEEREFSATSVRLPTQEERHKVGF